MRLESSKTTGFPRWHVRAVDSAYFAESIHRTRRDGCNLSGSPCGFPSPAAETTMRSLRPPLRPTAPTAFAKPDCSFAYQSPASQFHHRFLRRLATRTFFAPKIQCQTPIIISFNSNAVKCPIGFFGFRIRQQMKSGSSRRNIISRNVSSIVNMVDGRPCAAAWPSSP